MSIESDADRLVFVSASDFGVAATYTAVSGGAARAVAGIFDNDYLEIEGQGEASASSLQPRFVCRTSDLTNGGREGDVLVIAAATYKVTVPRPDGTGMTTLWLENQA